MTSIGVSMRPPSPAALRTQLETPLNSSRRCGERCSGCELVAEAKLAPQCRHVDAWPPAPSCTLGPVLDLAEQVDDVRPMRIGGCFARRAPGEELVRLVEPSPHALVHEVADQQQLRCLDPFGLRLTASRAASGQRFVDRRYVAISELYEFAEVAVAKTTGSPSSV
jgi:hypothetical protein